MKRNEEADDLEPEYDFANMPGGARGKYAAAYRGGAHLARLDPDPESSSSDPADLRK